ncbi:MAG: hypothetical protein AAB664_02855, partial [Patescibacteria group bacterium]
MSHKFYFFVAVIFFPIFLLGFFFLSSQSAKGNSAPTISTAIVSSISNSATSSESTIVPSPATTKTVYVFGTASVADGGLDISTVGVSFFRTTITYAGCDAANDENNNYCYRSGCTITEANASSTNVHYECQIPLQYYADATTGSGAYATTTWTAIVKATDVATATGDNTASPLLTEIGDIVAISIPSTYTWGTLELGTNTSSSTNASLAVTQTGNTVADIYLSGTDLTCTSGVMPVSYVSYVFTDTFGGTALSASSTHISTFDLPL